MKLYETEADRKRERDIAAYIVNKYGGQMHQNEPQADFDYLYTSPDGKKANIEMRCRNHSWGKYSTVYIKAAKLSAAMTAYRNHRIPFKFVVRTMEDNKIMCCTVNEETLPKTKNAWRGRGQMRDIRDREWVVEIPIKEFKKL